MTKKGRKLIIMKKADFYRKLNRITVQVDWYPKSEKILIMNLRLYMI